MKESVLMKQIMLAAPKWNCRLFRNNTGILRDARGQHVKFGLCVGSSDLIGWTICDAAAIFTAVEVKQRGKKPTKSQALFLEAVKQAGGIACVAYGIEDVAKAIGERDDH